LSIKIDPNIYALVKQTSLPEDLGFGKYFSPIMVSAHYQNNRWQNLCLKPYESLVLDPATMVFHYGQSIFEGMKAYRNNDSLHIYRPIDHAKRFQLSACRIAIPELPVEMFVTAVTELTRASAPLIPQDEIFTFYIRPFIFADQIGLGVKASESYLFLVIGSPSGDYFSDQAVRVMIERKYYRSAASGGTGAVKTSGNYACSLLSDYNAKVAGFHQSLWLDSKSGKYIEEMTGMNFFVVRKGKLVTPPLNNSILSGITRNTLFYLAKELGIEVVEKPLPIDEVTSDITNGQIEECFICGTAAGITSVALLGEESGQSYALHSVNGPITTKLRQALNNAQRGKIPVPKEWILKI